LNTPFAGLRAGSQLQITAASYARRPSVEAVIGYLERKEYPAALEFLGNSADSQTIIDDPEVRASAYTVYLDALVSGDSVLADKFCATFLKGCKALRESVDAKSAAQTGLRGCLAQGDLENGPALLKLAGVSAREAQTADVAPPTEHEDELVLPAVEARISPSNEDPEIETAESEPDEDNSVNQVNEQTLELQRQRIRASLANHHILFLPGIASLLADDKIEPAIYALSQRPDRLEILQLKLLEERATAAYKRARQNGKDEIAEKLLQAFSLPSELRDVPIDPIPPLALRLVPIPSANSRESLLNARAYAKAEQLLDDIATNRDQPALARFIAFARENGVKGNITEDLRLMTALIKTCITIESGNSSNQRAKLEKYFGFKTEDYLPPNYQELVSSIIKKLLA
jgi:hypothetical protein